ncbi:MAG: TRAP transporter large permease subunit [Rhodobacteraceae bacterium]|nr:TRAP transporter large permease subunit [Paracoccaceae bacterium]
MTAIIGLACLFALLLLGVPIGISMGAVGFVGFAAVVALKPAAAMLGQTTYETALNGNLALLPMFVLMGNLVSQSRLASDMYDASNALLGRFRGGLAMATIGACAMFSAVCGSSLATAATMSRVAVPAMRRFNYADSLAAGSVAAGGTLGMLIPPSVVMVLYGIMTQNSIGKLFIAGVLPGLVGVVFYLGAVRWAVWRRPESGPAAEPMSAAERWRAFRGASGVLILLAVVIGGIYSGVFTPSEAAGIGAFTAFLLALAKRSLTWKITFRVFVETAQTTATLFLVLIGATLFANFMDVAGLPSELKAFLLGLGLRPFFLLIAILLVYLVLGCFLESISMILLTLPIFYPIVMSLGYDPIWFGVLLIVVTEISMITPPIGMNVFVLNVVLPDVPLQTIFRGLVPFICADVLRLSLLIGVPWIITVLPSMMG